MNTLALAILPLILHVCGACTGGWHSFRHGGPCFKIFYSHRVSWNDAKRKCEGDQHAVLAQVTDYSTHTHLVKLISDTHPVSGSDQFFMIGATDYSGSWTWENQQSHVSTSHTYWLDGTPDNYCRPQPCVGHQHCLAYTNKNSGGRYGWDDISCDVHTDYYNYYICEKNASGHSGPVVG
ncbi:C-type lectin lectoxin-Lio3-like isoform X2 [Argopecten irradians]|uniref:C-type lectin lectoxin-Lio3-like isoform X2 n=1 Tax=Argopecten irradians TaxID=31199 RepID=UPI00371AD92D